MRILFGVWNKPTGSTKHKTACSSNQVVYKEHEWWIKRQDKTKSNFLLLRAKLLIISSMEISVSLYMYTSAKPLSSSSFIVERSRDLRIFMALEHLSAEQEAMRSYFLIMTNRVGVFIIMSTIDRRHAVRNDKLSVMTSPIVNWSQQLNEGDEISLIFSWVNFIIDQIIHRQKWHH